MQKYVIERNQVYAGQLIKDIGAKCIITDSEGTVLTEEELKKQGINFMSFSGGLVCRGMLFTIKDNVARDLIYTTPSNYSLDGLTSSVVTPREFSINEWIKLEETLKYLGYGEKLTQKDLYKIYKKLICSQKWLERNMELFGWKKSMIGYTSGGIATLPMEDYRKLSSISCCENGKPNKEEPGFALIKRKRG